MLARQSTPYPPDPNPGACPPRVQSTPSSKATSSCSLPTVTLDQRSSSERWLLQIGTYWSACRLLHSTNVSKDRAKDDTPSISAKDIGNGQHGVRFRIGSAMWRRLAFLVSTSAEGVVADLRTRYEALSPAPNTLPWRNANATRAQHKRLIIRGWRPQTVMGTELEVSDRGARSRCGRCGTNTSTGSWCL